MSDIDMGDIDKKMHKAVERTKGEFSGLRTGRASSSMLDKVMVNAYGAMTPLNQVSAINVPEARLLSVTVWDNNLVKNVEKAIAEAELGLNPQTEGNVLRIPIPELNEERRVELTKVAGKYAEAGRVAVRNIRRDAMDSLKKAEKDGDIGQDEAKRLHDQVQKHTDDHIKAIDTILAEKEKEIMQV